jgi:hypothetical protein
VVFKDGTYAIREVCCVENGKIQTWTENPMAPMGETFEELKEGFEFYQTALEKSVLYFDTHSGTLVEQATEN